MLSDKEGWMLISGTFIAQGGEKYITIGNFQSDSQTNIDTIASDTLPDVGNYYIDDVSVTQCDTTSIDEASAASIGLTVFPNPATGIVTITAKKGDEIIISDLTGRKIKTLENFQGTINFSIAGIEAGIYFVLLNEKGHLVGKQKLMVVK